MTLVLWLSSALAAPTLDVVGDCPGTVDVLVTDATPHGTLALLSGQPGQGAIPAGVCAGTPIELRNPALRSTLRLGPSGWSVMTFNLPAAACSQQIEVFDLDACAASPAVSLVPFDDDLDGYDAVSRGGEDCDDNHPAVNPAQTEVPGNGLDDDCDPLTDDLVVCTPYVPDPALSAGEPAHLAGITDLHNELRALVGADPVRWSTDLADAAQRWADQCTFSFDQNRSPFLGFPYIGQNLAWGSPSVSTDALELAHASAAERFDCNVAAPLTPTTIQRCGHYTQMVWDRTTLIGCGVATCTNITPDRTYLVCSYAAGGNYTGQYAFTAQTEPCLDQDSDGVLQPDDRFDLDPVRR